jgi:hypothetical protein
MFRRPWDLKVRDAETAKHARNVQQGADLALMFREAVVRVRV